MLVRAIYKFIVMVDLEIFNDVGQFLSDVSIILKSYACSGTTALKVLIQN